MILFCLPYAGGSGVFYSSWKKYLEPNIQVIPIELKGRGGRINEPFYNDITEAVEDIISSLINYLGGNEYAIYGHSMGGLLAYELYYKMEKLNLKKPTHIFFSATNPPFERIKEKETQCLSNSELIEKVLALGGTPKEVFENSETSSIFLPIIKADFMLLEDFIFDPTREKINCGITLLNGLEDSIVSKEISKWDTLVLNKFNSFLLDGNHFFIHTNAKKITDIISESLKGGAYET
ncbi:thioesterase II family protein [Lysinibacillus xylanilyticus]|uniref:thioesterase II family protein n=1 Tax=Lysinibacillus xylanilyticus TaxID=582475 RepID=UPI003808188C